MDFHRSDRDIRSENVVSLVKVIKTKKFLNFRMNTGNQDSFYAIDGNYIGLRKITI